MGNNPGSLKTFSAVILLDNGDEFLDDDIKAVDEEEAKAYVMNTYETVQEFYIYQQKKGRL